MIDHAITRLAYRRRKTSAAGATSQHRIADAVQAAVSETKSAKRQARKLRANR